MNKKTTLLRGIASLIIAFTCSGLSAQTVSTFETHGLPADSSWNGSDSTGGFADGNAFFPNTYVFDTVYGSYWASGWAYSTMKDTTTQGFSNLYSARPGIGYGSSLTYAIGQQNASIRLQGIAAGKQVNGVYITNTAYAALSMKNGDAFSKKFGGSSGNDPDWFKLSITGYDGCCSIADTVHFYLADYRFSNNTQDYIVKTWEWVDLSPLGNVDSLLFILSSTDNGTFGMNTPAFFCIDNFTTADSPSGIALKNSQLSTISLWPNPAQNFIHIFVPENNKSIEIMSMDGKIIKSLMADKNNINIDISTFSSGLYFIRYENTITKFIRY